MATDRVSANAQLVVDNAPLELTFIENPSIEDVLIGEARVQATSIETNNPSLLVGRRVSRTIRDYLIRLGVEQ